MGFVAGQCESEALRTQTDSQSIKMSFCQENYQFIKDVYEMRNSKMAEWLENVEKAIARIMADKVYTSAEFKRERDTFNSLCKDLERTEVKKWLEQILEILMAERAKDQKKTEGDKLDALIQKHEELIPNVQKTSVMVDLYWKCYAYGDELKPHVEFLDGIMLSSTRDIAPSCVENVDELIERQEKSLSQLDSKRNVVTDLIAKGKVILQNPDKPKFLEGNVKNLTAFDNSLKAIDAWKDASTAELKDIRESSGGMLPEDRVARTMDLQEDIAAKLEIIKGCAATELALLPQGDKVPADAQAFKDELNRITKYVTELDANTKIECNKYSNDVKYWAEYRTGIKEFTPWLLQAEKAASEGLAKPADLAEVKALNEKVLGFDKNCVNYLKVLTAAQGAAQKMTTHAEADAEVAGLKGRFDAVKAIADTWVKKCDVLVKEWVLLDNTVTELNSWVAKDKSAEGENQFSLEKMESTLGELKNIFKQKEKLVEGL